LDGVLQLSKKIAGVKVVDRITKSLLADFQHHFQLENEREDRLFEMFCNYSIVSRFVGGEFEIQDVLTGGTNDGGIDGLAFIASGQLIDSIDMLEVLTQQQNIVPEIKMIFIQSKTSPQFHSGDILKFWHGVKIFLEDDPYARRNKEIEEKADILRYITEHPLAFRSIAIKLFYVTTGRYLGDESNTLIDLKRKIKAEICDVNITDDVEMHFLGALEIQKQYKQTKRRPYAAIKFERNVLLPEIEGIQEAYIGYLPLAEFKKLIVDQEGEMKKGIYYDNVRDFKGEKNPVNTEIANTLRSPKSDQLVVLNNGVTIVAKRVRVSRDVFHLEDYQIVNGCQTSHMIYNCLDKVDADKVGLQIKLIVTENDEVTNEVIKATNNQTPVKREELLALSDYQKQLEDYYDSFEDKSLRLYYERRSDQYAFAHDVEKVRIVEVKQQIKSFAAMFLERPEQAKGYFGSLIKNIEGTYFLEGHRHIVYYTSAFALYKLEYFFRNRSLDSKYRKFAYQILMLLKYVINGKTKVPRLNSPKIDGYCDKIIHTLNSDQALPCFREAIGLIEQVVSDIHDKSLAKKRSLTEELLKTVRT
jgi:hypothetical protein